MNCDGNEVTAHSRALTFIHKLFGRLLSLSILEHPLSLGCDAERLCDDASASARTIARQAGHGTIRRCRRDE